MKGQKEALAAIKSRRKPIYLVVVNMPDSQKTDANMPHLVIICPYENMRSLLAAGAGERAWEEAAENESCQSMGDRWCVCVCVSF